MQFPDILRAENDARREQLRAKEAARQEQEPQAILDDAKQTVLNVIDTLVREAATGEIPSLPQNVTMKYEPERTLWIKGLQKYAKEEGISLCIDYNFGIMEFIADPREPDCTRLHDAFMSLVDDVAANYVADAERIFSYVKEEMLRAVRNGSGNEERVTVSVRLLEQTPGADHQPNLFANWKSSLEFMQYTTAGDLLSDIRNVQTAEDMTALFSTEQSRCLREHQSLKKMTYALRMQAEDAGLTMIPAGEWMPFANMTAGILLFSAEL